MKKINYKYTIIIFFNLFINFFFGKEKIFDINNQYIFNIQNNNTNNYLINNVLKYKAKEINNSLEKKILFLHKNVELQYKDVFIYADYIKINWETGWIYGRGKIDPTGKITKLVYLIKKKNRYNCSEFYFNYIKNIGEIKNISNIQNNTKFIFLKKITKINKSIFYITNGFYTTDKYYINKKNSLPQYHIKINKIIYNHHNKIFLGLNHIYIKNHFTPIVFPLLYNFQKNLNTLNILNPKIGKCLEKGFFIKNLGYYYIINKNINLKILIDLFSNQNYNIINQINYIKKNQYYGYLKKNYSLISKTKKNIHKNNIILSYLEWKHKNISKKKQNWKFSSKIKFIKSKNLTINIRNNTNIKKIIYYLQSLICLEKNYFNPLHNVIIISYNQYYNKLKLINNNKPIYNFKLPQLTLNVKRQFPFYSKKYIHNSIIKNLNINYIFNIENYIYQNDNNELFSSMTLKNINNNIKNKINITTKYLFNYYINIFLGLSYEDTRNFNLNKKTLNNNIDKKKLIFNNLFKSYNNIIGYSTIQTYLSKSININQKNEIKILRHIIIPKISYTFKSNNNFLLNNYYQYNTLSDQIICKKNNIFYHKIDISIDNKLEILIHNNEQNLLKIKKIKLLDNFLIKSSYNFTKPYLKWNDIIINLKKNIFHKKLKIKFNIHINPYKLSNILISKKNNLYIINYLKPNLLNNFNVLLKYSTNNNFNKNKKKNYSIHTNKILNTFFYFTNYKYLKFYKNYNFDFEIMYNYSNKNFFNNQHAFLYLKTNIKIKPIFQIIYCTKFDLIKKFLLSNKIIFSYNLKSLQINAIYSPFNTKKNWSIFLGIKI